MAFAGASKLTGLARIGAEIGRAGVHGITQGYTAWMGANLKGQDFTLSNFAVTFATGSLSSLASSGLGAIGNQVSSVGKFSNSLVGNMAFGGLIGGATSAALGGNFWEGFATGAIVSGLNHGLHTIRQMARRANALRKIANAREKKILNDNPGDAKSGSSGKDYDQNYGEYGYGADDIPNNKPGQKAKVSINGGDPTEIAVSPTNSGKSNTNWLAIPDLLERFGINIYGTTTYDTVDISLRLKAVTNNSNGNVTYIRK